MFSAAAGSVVYPFLLAGIMEAAVLADRRHKKIRNPYWVSDLTTVMARGRFQPGGPFTSCY
ncbi:hypothetical protein D083_2025 [Dickeya solani RNS 08.23.3.1.A]|nr:hypothetical protein D083_2025 [Dickeya solani RNS 08.23.3.1.A]